MIEQALKLKGGVMRKKLVVVMVTLILLSGCSQQPRQVLHPPAWIHGKWIFEGSSAWYEFTATTVFQGMPGTVINLGELYRLSKASVKEVITDTLYSYTIMTDQAQGVFQTMEFSKVTGLSISMTLISNIATIGPVMLYRQ